MQWLVPLYVDLTAFFILFLFSKSQKAQKDY